MQLDKMGNWVRMERLRRGLTQQQLSEIAGTSKGRIEAIETGCCMEMRLATVVAILSALGEKLELNIKNNAKS